MNAELTQAAVLVPDGEAALLDIERTTFRTGFDRRPFRIGHLLAGHSLFSLERLLELSHTLPEKDVEYNAGDVPISLDPRHTPRTGLSIPETIRRIEECRSWMVLKNVEQDPDYCALLDRCLDEVRAFSEPLDPGMKQREGYIFISSAGSVTPFHIDPEHNFLLQIRGRKTVHLFDGADRSVLSEEDLEHFHAGRHRNLAFRPEYEGRDHVFELTPGDGLYFPVTAPHWVKNGAEVSISFSITFRTPAVEQRQAVYFINHNLRRHGWQPTPPGRSSVRDGAKILVFRALRRIKPFLSFAVRRGPNPSGAKRMSAAP